MDIANGQTLRLALTLPVLAGLSTALGSLLGIFLRKPNARFMSITLGFSAGVMIYVSFGELLQEGMEAVGFIPANIAFFGGMLLMLAVDALTPHQYLAETHRIGQRPHNGELLRAGIFCAIGIAIHNFPEGMATFAGTLQDPALGVAIATAIAIHNIPEGLAISVPVYAATGSRRKAFWWSVFSGLAEPVGAVLAAIVLGPFLNPIVLGYVLAAVAGIMVFISLDELMPIAKSYDREHDAILGGILGMIVMALSIWLLS